MSLSSVPSAAKPSAAWQDGRLPVPHRVRVPMPTCTACGGELPASGFSKAQLKKPDVLSCADRDSMLNVAQSEKEALLRGAVRLVQHDADSALWARSGKLSARGQGLADAVPGWCKDTFVVECNLGRHNEELNLVGALVTAVDALPASVAPDGEILELVAALLDNMGTSCVHYDHLGLGRLLRSRRDNGW